MCSVLNKLTLNGLKRDDDGDLYRLVHAVTIITRLFSPRVCRRVDIKALTMTFLIKACIFCSVRTNYKSVDHSSLKSFHLFKIVESVINFCLKKISDSIILNREVLRLQQFYNIFTTNHGWLVIIGSSLNLVLRLLF